MKKLIFFPLLLVGLSIYKLRLHICDLVEIAKTYATFPSLEKQLLTYPPADAEAAIAAQSDLLAPKILHQIVLSEGGSHNFSKYDSARNSCISLHQDWNHWLWTDENATDWVSAQYPDIYPLYVNYTQTIQRTNILRYLLLHKYGGVYLDMDIACRVSLDSLRYLPFLTPAAHPAGINNAFILAKPEHPFLSEVIARIPVHNLKWQLPYVENMLTTGCMFITNAWMSYMRRNEEHRWEDKVFLLADKDGQLESQMLRGKVTTPLFEHGGASSWHGWDSQVILLVGKYYKPLLVLFGVVTLCWMGIMSLAFWGRPAFMKRRQRFDNEKLWEDRE